MRGRVSRSIAEDIQPLEGYQRLVGRVSWVLAAALLGALTGFGLSSIRPLTYRATAILVIGVDYSRSLWLDEDADRLALGRVQELILSDDVLGDVLERTAAGSRGGSNSPRSISELRAGMRLLWVDSRWELSVEGRDPEQAAETANAWAESALEQLDLAAKHAWRVAELQSLFFRVFCRPAAPPGGTEESLWVCDEGIPSSETAGIPTELITEIEQSRGIIPALSFGWEARATPPTEPENGNRALMILGGMLVGLLVGTIAVAAAGDPPA